MHDATFSQTSAALQTSSRKSLRQGHLRRTTAHHLLVMLLGHSRLSLGFETQTLQRACLCRLYED